MQPARDKHPWNAADRHIDPRLSQLRHLLGVVDLPARRGEVLLHCGHTPPGVFLFVDGGVTLTAPCGCTESVDTHNGKALAGWFLFPSLGELTEQAGRNAILRRNGHLVLVPRSLLMFDSKVGALLSSWLLREVSLRAQPDPPGLHD